MNHHHGYGRHQHSGSRHSNDGSGRSCNAVNLDSYVAFVFHQHIVDLCRGNTVASGRVDPYSYIALARKKLVLEKLRCNIIVEPALLSDGAVEEQGSLCVRLILRPLPELLNFHWCFPPFLQYFCRQMLRLWLRGACCRL